jgi:hemerythrin superfamily protein
MADLNIRDCFSLLIEDHRAVEELYERYSESDDLESKKQYLRVFIRDLSIHSGIEEAYVYPLMDKNLKHGGSLHQFSLDQHQHLKEDLKYLDTTELTEDNVTDFNQRLFGLIADLKHHTDHEEKDVFPAMRDALSMEQRADLLSQLEKAKSMVPTHPHPHTPNVSLTGLNIITTIQGYIDRSLDLYKGVDKK